MYIKFPFLVFIFFIQALNYYLEKGKYNASDISNILFSLKFVFVKEILRSDLSEIGGNNLSEP